MAGEAAYAAAVAKHLAAERTRLSELGTLKSEYERTCEAERQRIATQHEAIDSLRRGYLVGEEIAAATIFELLLEADSSKHGLSSTFVVSPAGGKGELDVTQGLPGPEVIPNVAGYRYIKSRDAIEPIARPYPHVVRLHRSLIAQLALRTIWVLFAADEANVLTGVWLTCYAHNRFGANSDEPVHKFWSTKRALNDVVTLPSRCFDNMGCRFTAKSWPTCALQNTPIPSSRDDLFFRLLRRTRTSFNPWGPG
jgi:hypothetical protein